LRTFIDGHRIREWGGCRELLHTSCRASHGFLHLSFLLSTPYVVVVKVHRVRSSCREQVVVVVVAWALLRKEQAVLCSWEALIVIMMHDVVGFICLWLQRRRRKSYLGALRSLVA
jgi:TctA family transporter